MNPGELSVSSIFTRKPAAFNCCCNSSNFSKMDGFFFHGPTGIKTTCVGATFGGNTNPCSSPCVIINEPIKRVETPHEVVCAYTCSFSFVKYLISNASANFVPI